MATDFEKQKTSAELSNVLLALKEFSIPYLQKTKLEEREKNNLFLVVNHIHELEKMLEALRRGEDIQYRAQEYRTNIWNLIQNNDNQAPNLKLADKLISIFTQFYLQTITTGIVAEGAKETKPVNQAEPVVKVDPQQSQKNNIAPTEPESEVKSAEEKKPNVSRKASEYSLSEMLIGKVKVLEESKKYVPNLRNTYVLKLEESINDALSVLQNPDIIASDKEKYINAHINEIDETINKIASNTEVVLTTMQISEIRSISPLLKELAKGYAKKITLEDEEERKLARDIEDLNGRSDKTLSERVQLLDAYNAYASKLRENAKFNAAELSISESLKFSDQLLVGDGRDKVKALFDHAEESSHPILVDYVMQKISAYKQLGHSFSKQEKYKASKEAFKKAINLYSNIPNDYLSVDQKRVKVDTIAEMKINEKAAEEKETEIKFKQHPAMLAFKDNQKIIKQSQDKQLLQMANKNLANLYDNLVDSQSLAEDKIQLINEFAAKWQKLIEDKTANENVIVDNAEIDKAVKEGLPNSLRDIREMFAALNSSQQLSSSDSTVEEANVVQQAALKAKEEEQIRARAQAKARAEAMKLKAEAKAREEALALQMKTDYEAKLKAEEEAKVTAALAAKLRDEELLKIRKEVTQSIKEVKDLHNKVIENINKHDYKKYLKEEQNKLLQTISELEQIKVEERISADLFNLAKFKVLLADNLHQSGKLNDMHKPLKDSVKIYDVLLDDESKRNKALELKVDSLVKLGMLCHKLKKYVDCEKYYMNAAITLRKLRDTEEFGTDQKQQMAKAVMRYSALAMLAGKAIAKIPIPDEEAPTINPVFATLYHFDSLKRKAEDDEMKFIQHLFLLDKNFSDVTPQLETLQMILVKIETAALQPTHANIHKSIALEEVLEDEDEKSSSALELIDKNLLHAYLNSLINLSYAEILREHGDKLPSEMHAFVLEIKAIRYALREGDEAKFASLGLTAEEKVIYLAYEIRLAQEDRAKETESTAAIDKSIANMRKMLLANRELYHNPNAEQTPTNKTLKHHWSIGRVLSAFKIKKKKGVIRNNVSTNQAAIVSESKGK